MDPKDLLKSEIQQFIFKHEADDEKKLLLRHKLIFDVSASLIADQIVGKRKAKQKLPSWFATPNILYPPALNIEQSSSEITAGYKADFLKKLGSGLNKAADLTGGFGVDSFFLSTIFKDVDYVEPDENLFEITKHNITTLVEAKSKKQEAKIHFHQSTAENFLVSIKQKYDLIYIDPSRRSKGNQKNFLFTDCQPNVVELIPQIFEWTDYLLIKSSPLIDLQSGMKELEWVEKIFVVAIDNECKEVLFLCRKDFKGEPEIRAVNLKSSENFTASESFNFQPSEEKLSVSGFSDPLNYLYEPHAALLKSGAFKLIGNRYQLQKLHQHTHLYTSDALIKNFPGKVFEIESIGKPDAKFVIRFFPEGKANVVTRNYPLSPEQLKKKAGLKDGGEKFLIGFTGQSKKFIAVCNRIT